MKKVKRIASVLLATVMVLAMSISALAAGNNQTITITNAAKGETYKVYKLFDASITGNEGGSIAYTGDIPAALKDYFQKDGAGNITATEAAGTGDAMSDGLKSALKTWTDSATAAGTKEGTGSAVVFEGLAPGYYVVTTSQGDQLITVTSTNPNATIVDKNSSSPKDLQKTSDKDGDAGVKVGDTVTYTVSFVTSNYDGAGTSAKQIASYQIKDTLPDYLSDVSVSKITIKASADEDAATLATLTNEQFTNGVISLDWVDADKKSIYPNGAVVTVTYTATVDADAAIDGEGNTNTVYVGWTTTDNTVTPPDGTGNSLTDTDTIYTYAIALKKVDDKGNALAGAEFTLPEGLKVAAVSTSDTAGDVYVVSKDTAAVSKVTTGKSGLIIIKGVDAGTYSFTESDAPDGYNQLTAPVSVTAVKTGSTETKVTKYLDKDGNVTDTVTETKVEVTSDISAAVEIVVNKTGIVLPTTGGAGTTMFYVVGGVLVAAAAVLFVTKKRMKRS